MMRSQIKTLAVTAAVAVAGLGGATALAACGSSGPRVTPAQAAGLGAQVPAGAHVNQAARTITFTTTSVRLSAAASPAGGPDETFRIAGMVNPKVIVPAGAQVRIEVVNADADTA